MIHMHIGSSSTKKREVVTHWSISWMLVSRNVKQHVAWLYEWTKTLKVTNDFYCRISLLGREAWWWWFCTSYIEEFAMILSHVLLSTNTNWEWLSLPLNPWRTPHSDQIFPHSRSAWLLLFNLTLYYLMRFASTHWTKYRDLAWWLIDFILG